MNPLKRARTPRRVGAPRRLAALGLAAGRFRVPAAAQDASSYPNKPVRIFVPYGAGGVGDLTMRLLAQKLSDNTGQQFVIENRPGAGGSLSARGALSAPADGYSLAVTGNGQAISMTLFKSRTYDVLTDFTQVSVTGTFEMLLAVRQDSPFKTLQDVVDFARKNPGKLNLGAVNPGSTQNLSAHLFKQTTDTQVTIVPHKTTPDLVTGILRGDIDLGFDFYAGFQGALSDKQIRILATSGEAAQSAAQGRADRDRKRLAELCRDQLERPRQPRRTAGSDSAKAQRAHRDGARRSRFRSGPQAGHRHARQHARANARPHGERHRQMAQRDREGEHRA